MNHAAQAVDAGGVAIPDAVTRFQAFLERERERLFEPYDPAQSKGIDYEWLYRFGDGGIVSFHCTNAEARAALTRTPAPADAGEAVVPWPEDPTDEMLIAGLDALCGEARRQNEVVTDQPDQPFGQGLLVGRTMHTGEEIAACYRAMRAAMLAAHPAIDTPGSTRGFPLGTRVRKTKGSSWQGHVVGYYSTALTPDGVCVESEREPGSVQIYPLAALKAIGGGLNSGSARESAVAGGQAPNCSAVAETTYAYQNTPMVSTSATSAQPRGSANGGVKRVFAGTDPSFLHLAVGCRSSASPCDHRRRDPATLCLSCKRAWERARAAHDERIFGESLTEAGGQGEATREKAIAIAEAAANRWDAFSDRTGVNWLAERILALAARPAPPTGVKPEAVTRDLSDLRTLVGKFHAGHPGLETPDQHVGWLDEGLAEIDRKLCGIIVAFNALSPPQEAPTPAVGDGWEPIETAPTNEAHVLVARPGAPCIRAFCRAGTWWMHGDGPFRSGSTPLEGQFAPTHWRPLPAPPALANPQPPTGDTGTVETGAGR